MNKITRNLTVFTALICWLINPVFSQTSADSYIILFKTGAGVIDPPNPENAGKVPFGVPTSGQSKADVVAALGLNGEIVAILEVNNGIVARIDEQEAERLRQDVRVASVDKGVEGSFLESQERADYPVYRDGRLIIPRVDTDELPGAYLDGVFEFDADSNSWRLREFKVSELSASGKRVYFLDGDDVEVEVTDSFPAQVFLKIRGHLANGCLEVGGIHQRLKDKQFEVVVNAVSKFPDDGKMLCTQALVPFERRVPLQVYGLPRGTYGYIVNGEIEGSFYLIKDNTP